MPASPPRMLVGVVGRIVKGLLRGHPSSPSYRGKAQKRLSGNGPLQLLSAIATVTIAITQVPTVPSTATNVANSVSMECVLFGAPIQRARGQSRRQR